MTKSFQVAIIIVSWNVKDLLRDCLNALFSDIAASNLAATVWVVDSASSDGSVAMLEAEFPHVNLIASSENLGFARGNNVALRALDFPEKAEGQPETILLLNPDTIIKPGALQKMLTLMLNRPNVGIVGANLRFGDGSFQHGAYAFPGLWQLAFEFFPLPGRFYESPLNGRYPHALYTGQSPFPIDHPLGAAMLVRGAAIHQVGLLDEAYYMYVEEVDWAWRIKAAGWQAYCHPAAHIVHLGGQSTSQIKQESFLNLWRSRQRFYHSHYGGLKYKLASFLVRWGLARKMKTMPAQRDLFEKVQRIWQI